MTPPKQLQLFTNKWLKGGQQGRPSLYNAGSKDNRYGGK